MGGSGSKGKVLLARIWRCRFLYILFIPVLAYYIVFKYRPMWGLLIVFKDFKAFKGFAASEWVGLLNFKTFFSSREFWSVLKNTIILNLYGVVLVFPMPIILALSLNEIKREKFKKTVQTVSYLPYFISTVVAVSIVSSVLSPSSGPIALIYNALGKEPINFLGLPQYYRKIYIISDIWSSVGYGSIIYLAAISGTDPALYEAATIDGAGRFKQLIHVTLPCIAPTIIIMLILRVGTIMDSNFEKAFLLGNEATRSVSDVISTFVFRRGIIENSPSFASAVGLFNSVIGLIFVYFTNLLSRKTSETSLW